MILEKLLKTAVDRTARRQRTRPLNQLESYLPQAPAPRGFVRALVAGVGLGLIAELKPASPSAGVIRQPFPVSDLARALVAGGADCLSVLTEEEHFGGSLGNLEGAAAGVPRLQKDFLLTEYQILEGRLAGADAVLLIAEALSPARAQQLAQFALSLGMDVLYEAHAVAPLRQVLQLAETQPERILIGINNRDLGSFEVDVETTLRALQWIPEHLHVVGESGIHSAEDVGRLRDAGVRGILVGESLMRQPDVTQAVRSLLSRVRSA